MKTVAILCARSDSDYKALAHCDVYDAERDARTFSGGLPVVAHPPCRLWGQLFRFARVENPEAEKALGLWCVDQVREHGGVLEHPIRSKLWPAAGLPEPGDRDSFGGFTVAMPQQWFGHRAEKWSWFYVCGCERGELPEIPFQIGEASHVIETRKRVTGQPVTWRPSVTKRERDATPPPACRLAHRNRTPLRTRHRLNFPAMKKNKPETPLFVPLKTRFFRYYQKGLKSTEFRPEGRGWNAETCRIGRAVVLSHGYGKAERMTGRIVSYSVQPDASQVPGWRECYGDKPGPVACIGIKVSV